MKNGRALKTSLRVPKVNTMPKGFVAVCVFPGLFMVLLFLIYPLLSSVSMSFTDAMSLTGRSQFIGFNNYVRMLTLDPHFKAALRNTLQYMAVVPAVVIFLALFFAFALTQTKLKERGVYRTLFFLPSVLSLVVVAVVFSAIFDPRPRGPLNSVLVDFFGLEPIPWLGSSTFAIWAITIVMIWQATGYYMVLHIAAIDSISKEIFEAADIDGAKGAAKFFWITIPMLRDSIGITYILALSSTMGTSFILGRVMTAFGPGTSTLVLLGHMYNMAFGAAVFGYAMAIAVFSLLMALLLSYFSRKLTYRESW